MGKVEIHQTSTQIRELSLQEFVDKMPEILKSKPSLKGLQAVGLSLQDMQKHTTVSFSYADKKIFNVSGDSELLTKLTDAIKAFYKA